MSNDDEEKLEDENMQASIVDKPLLRRYTGKFLTIKEVGQILKVSQKTVRNWIQTGLLEAAKLPQRPGARRTHYRVRGRAVDAIIHQQEEKPKE